MIQTAEASRSELPFDAERFLRTIGLQLFLAGALSLFGMTIFRLAQLIAAPVQVFSPFLIVIFLGLLWGLPRQKWEAIPPLARGIPLGLLLFLWLCLMLADAFDRIAYRGNWSEHEQLTGAFTVIGLLLVLSNDRRRELLRGGQQIWGQIRSVAQRHVRGTLAVCLLAVCLLNESHARWGCQRASVLCESIGLYGLAIGCERLAFDVSGPRVMFCGNGGGREQDEKYKRFCGLEHQWAWARGLEPDFNEEPTASPTSNSTSLSLRRFP